LIGFILGAVAYNKANTALNNLRGGRGSAAERSSLQTTKTIAVVGMVLAAVMFVAAIFLRVAGGR
jgi:hypothetical protein